MRHHLSEKVEFQIIESVKHAGEYLVQNFFACWFASSEQRRVFDVKVIQNLLPVKSGARMLEAVLHPVQLVALLGAEGSYSRYQCIAPSVNMVQKIMKLSLGKSIKSNMDRLHISHCLKDDSNGPAGSTLPHMQTAVSFVQA